MSEWIDIPLATQVGKEVATGASYVSDAELVNLMLKANPQGTRAPFHIASTPGLVAFGTIPSTGRIRGVCTRYDGAVFVIQGTDIFYSTLNMGGWTMVPIGNMPGTSPCRMVDAKTHIVAVDGTNARAITTAQSFACSRGNFSDVAYQDGYAIFTETGSNSLYTSNLDNPVTISALDFTTVDALAGNLVGVISDHREVYAFKQESIEHYYNAGGAGFPFVRSSPGVLEKGCWPDGRLTIAKLENSVLWVGSDLRVYMMRGYQPEAISTPWVERFLDASVHHNGTPYEDVLYGSAFYHDGVPYYLLSNLNDPVTEGAKVSLVCNLQARLWHKLKHAAIDEVASVFPFVGNGGNEHLAIAVGNLAGEMVAGRLDAETPTELSSNLTRAITLPQVSAGSVRSFMPEIYMDMQKTTDGTLTLTWSDDGGATYTSGVTATMTTPRARWQRLGAFFQRILRFTITASASKIAIMAVRARIDAGAA